MQGILVSNLSRLMLSSSLGHRLVFLCVGKVKAVALILLSLHALSQAGAAITRPF
jgi:hypothetical protein